MSDPFDQAIDIMVDRAHQARTASNAPPIVNMGRWRAAVADGLRRQHEDRAKQILSRHDRSKISSDELADMLERPVTHRSPAEPGWRSVRRFCEPGVGCNGLGWVDVEGSSPLVVVRCGECG